MGINTKQDFPDALASQIKEYKTYLDDVIQSIQGGRTQLDCWQTTRPENYGFSIASYIYLYDVNDCTSDEDLQKIDALLSRAMICLRSPSVVSFTKEFILFFSLLSLLALPDSARTAQTNACAALFYNYKTNCSKINTNCAAMQYANEIMRRCLDANRRDVFWLEDTLDFIEQSQLPSGFINDSHSEEIGFEDGMPIAYHMFCLWLFLVPLLMEKTRGCVLPQGHEERLSAILHKGLSWLSQATAFDGSVAMAERSMYQVFTLGIHIALCTYEGKLAQAESLLIDMQQYRQADGSYACTPNNLDHRMRIGYENYTHKSDYSNLAVAGLVMASRLIEAGLSSQGMIGNEGHFLDEDSGYAFYRMPNAYFACTLRRHRDGYIGSASGFHYRLYGYSLPLAIPAERNSEIAEKATYIGGDMRQHAITMYTCQPIEEGFRFCGEDESVCYTKEICMQDGGIVWRLSLSCKQEIGKSVFTFPVIIDNGRDRLDVRKISATRLLMYFSGVSYLFTCAGGMGLELMHIRATESVSGVTSMIEATTGGLKKGDVFVGYVRLQPYLEDVPETLYYTRACTEPDTAMLTVARTSPYQVNRAFCTGCGACAQACPSGCINMEEDERAFIYPVFSQYGCSNCGRCVQVCPLRPEALHSRGISYPQPVTFGAWNRDDAVRLQSSSGGLFSVFARQFLDAGGKVCAARYLANLDVVFDFISMPEEIAGYHGSKYVESAVGDSYKRIKEYLDAGIPILFVGLPCQAAGLRSYLTKPYDHLLVVDIVCGGMPTRLAFRRYLQALERQEGSRVCDYAFRTKNMGWMSQGIINVRFADGVTKAFSRATDPYNAAYQLGYSVKEACFHCAFYGQRSQADITIGDFNGAARIKWDEEDALRKGISVMAVHNDKGYGYLKQIQSELMLRCFSFYNAARGNGRMHALRQYPVERDEWLKALVNDCNDIYKDLRLDALCFTALSVPPLSVKKGTLLSWTVSVNDTNPAIQYAWYLYKNNVRIQTQWYAKERTFSFLAEEPGEYKIAVFALRGDEKIRMYSINTVVIDT